MNHLTHQQIIDVADKTRTAESRDGDYILPISFAEAIIKANDEAAERATPAAQVAAGTVDTPPEFNDAMHGAFSAIRNDIDRADMEAIWEGMWRAATAPVSAAPPVDCTCPSGDGSLRWPCPEHPPAGGQELPALPKLPGHPDPMSMDWTRSELKAIAKYGEDCARAALAMRQPQGEDLSAAIQAAARDLPEGYNIWIDIERRAGTVSLVDPDCEETDVEPGDGLHYAVRRATKQAIERAAKQAGKEGGES